MYPSIIRAVPIGRLVFRAEFDNGESRRYDVRTLFNVWPVFRDLERIPGLFNQLRVDAGGYGVSWNGDIDLAAEEVWENGKF